MIAPTSFFGDYGCHVRILEESRILQKAGHQVTICTYHMGEDVPGQDIRRTMPIPGRRDYEVGSSRHKLGFDVLLFGRAVASMFQVRPHIIHAHLHEGALMGRVLSWLWRVPLVFDFQGSLTGEMLDHHFVSAEGPFFKPLRRLEEFIDRASPRILTSSAHAARLLVSDFRCRPERIMCTPDCVNVEVFRPVPHNGDWAALKRAWGIPTDRLVVVYLGLLAEYQGTSHLIHAAQTICQRRNDVHFLIAGYPNVEQYHQLSQDLDIADHVTFTGRVHYQDAPRILSLGDIAVSPKLSKSEGAGKLLNYMAMGLPTVTFDTPVSREYLGEWGIHAAAGDTEDLAGRIMSLLDDPEGRQNIGRALRRRAEADYSWDVAGRTIIDVYDALSSYTDPMMRPTD